MEELKKISTYQGALEVIIPFIEQVSYIPLDNKDSDISRMTIQDLKMDSLDTLEVFAKIEKKYATPSEYIFGNKEEEWRALRTVGDFAQKLSEFAAKKLAHEERIVIVSDAINTQIDHFLERAFKRAVWPEAQLKDFGGAARLKKWAEKHFGFTFSPEDKEAKIKTLGQFHQIVIKYCDEMKKL